jgi:Flp pilus assembly pilin Flp
MILTTSKALWYEEDGQDVVEYSLLLAFIALAAISVLNGAAGSLREIFGTSSHAVKPPTTTP